MNKCRYRERRERKVCGGGGSSSGALKMVVAQPQPENLTHAELVLTKINGSHERQLTWGESYNNNYIIIIIRLKQCNNLALQTASFHK